MDTLLTLSHATERDVDLLLVEELSTSRDFAQWITDQAGWANPITRWQVTHSKRRTQNRREIDIELSVTGAGDAGQAVLLIENKLGEKPQPNQAESYRQECAVLLKTNRCSHASSILVCPRDYVATQPDFARKFDRIIPYEDVAAFLNNRSLAIRTEQPELAARLAFRVELLNQAVGKLRRGYEPVPLKQLGSFSSQYVALLKRLAPAIIPGPSMLKPASPAESVSMIFDHAKTFDALPISVRPKRFAHEFGRGQTHRANYVAAVFGGWGQKFGSHKRTLLADLQDTGYRLEAGVATAKRPNPALRVIGATPPVDNHQEFGTQLAAISTGIQEAAKLREWLLGNSALLERWRARLA
jgi:hypothetical protein